MVGHIERPEEKYVGKRVKRITVGWRKRGRPGRRWRGFAKEDMVAAGVTEENAQGREKWGRLIRTGDPRESGLQACSRKGRRRRRITH